MPCVDGGPFSAYEEQQQKLNLATRVACNLVKLIRQRFSTAKLLRYTDNETVNWIKEHDRADAERALKAVLSKLTPEQRRLLGHE